LALTACGDDNGTGPDGGPSSITVPLAIGNTWTYEAASETLKIAQSDIDTSRIVGTADYKGETYFIMEEISEGDTSEILIRQEGQDVFVVPPFAESRKDDPLGDWFSRVIVASLPWKYADMDASSGTSWVVAEAETTMQFGPEEQTVRVVASCSSLGRTSVSVPAGDYNNVYVGELSIEITVGEDTSEPSSQKLWLADGVGLVKNEVTETQGDFGGEITVKNTSELVSYTLR
jgi:hypothetical protein